jgi:hypothetical protein
MSRPRHADLPSMTAEQLDAYRSRQVAMIARNKPITIGFAAAAISILVKHVTGEAVDWWIPVACGMTAFAAWTVPNWCNIGAAEFVRRNPRPIQPLQTSRPA